MKKLKLFRSILPLAIVMTLSAACSTIRPDKTADTLYLGGEILTMNGDQPNYAEAVAVKDGKIIGIGERQSIESTYKGSNTIITDLGGKTLIPGFVDAHGHVFNVGVQALAANQLAAPDGDVKDIASLQQKLNAWAKGKTSERLGWIVGFGYDDAQLKEQRHPTREDLDAVSNDVPILAIHQSGHLAAVNSKALELAKLTAATKNPPGGVIRRRSGSQEPDGVLEESAFWMVLAALPKMSVADKEAIAKAGQDLYLRFGYTTAEEGRSTPDIDGVWESLAAQGQLNPYLTPPP